MAAEALYEYLNLISIIAFYCLIAAFFIINRKKIEVQYKLFYLYHTKRGITFVRKLATKFRKFWIGFGYLSVPVGFIGMFFILGFLVWKLVELFISPAAVSSVTLFIPGVRIPGSPIFIPFWYGIISIIVVMVVHEGCHGFVSEAHGLKLKTVGVGMFTLIPLAFVNPDEKKLIKAPKKVQLSIFAAGPFANLVTAGVVLLLFTFLLIPITANNFEAKGIYVTDVGPEWHCKYFSSHFECPAEYPVEEAGLRKGEVIIGLNGQRTENITSFVVELNKLKPEQKISLMLEDRSIELTTSENIKNTSKAYLGLNLKQNIQLKEDSENKYGKLPWLALYISQLFYWLFALNIGIGLINLLPLGIVDGGRMVSIALSKVKNKRLAAKLFFFITMFSLFVLIFNLIGPYFKGLIL